MNELLALKCQLIDLCARQKFCIIPRIQDDNLSFVGVAWPPVLYLITQTPLRKEV